MGDGVFAICEPFQFQKAISDLILGSKSALLFDAGLGMGKINRKVKKPTSLPVIVLNSHTFCFSHEKVQGEVELAALAAACRRASTPRAIVPAPSPLPSS